MTGLSLREILLFLAPCPAGSVHVTWATQVVPREAFVFLNQRNRAASSPSPFSCWDVNMNVGAAATILVS